MDCAQQKCETGHPPIMAGGLGEEHPATKEIQDYCNLVKPKFLKESGVNATKFVAICYKSQVVAGTNVFVKVDLGDDQFCILKIFVPLPHTQKKPSLSQFQLGKTKTDPIAYF